MNLAFVQPIMFFYVFGVNQTLKDKMYEGKSNPAFKDLLCKVIPLLKCGTGDVIFENETLGITFLTIFKD